MEAKTIMGTDFIGPEEAENAFNIEGSIEVPTIPFSKEELKRAKELGQMLVLRLPMTMTEMIEKTSGRLKDGSKLLFQIDDGTGKLKDDAWYKNESFLNERMEAKWALVSKEVVPGSTGKNYLEQTDGLVSYLQNEVFKDRPIPETYQVAIEEFQRFRSDIEGTLSSDWPKAAEMLEGLRITNLTRQAPAESVYDFITYFQTTGERLLPNIYSWAGRRRSEGELVSVGGFRPGGVFVDANQPGLRGANLGVSFSRSL